MLSRRTLLLSTAAGVVRPWRTLGRLAPPDLAVLHTNDVHGRVEAGDQGLAHLAPEIRRLRGIYPTSLTLDAGDIIHGTPMEQRHGPEPVLAAFRSVGYDCATMGNHEFDFGPENLRRAARLARFPFLSANVRDADGLPWGPLRPSLVLDRGRRIGIFGLTTLETPKIQWPRTIETVRFTDPFTAAREQVALLRPKVDLLICLSHLGYAEDRKLAHEAPGIDLIVGGHSHTRLEKATLEAGVPIVQTGCWGKALGRIEVRFEGGKPSFDYLLIDAELDTDERVERAYAPLERRLEREMAEVLTVLREPMSFKSIVPEGRAGRFLPEAVRRAHRADVGLFAASQIGDGLAAGDVTRGDAYRCMGAYTRQHVVRMRVPAALLVERPSVLRVGSGTLGPSPLVAGPAHVMQDLFLGKPGTEILYDDPLGPSVRDAVMDGLKAGLATAF